MTEPAPLSLETVAKIASFYGHFLAAHLDAFEVRNSLEPVCPDDVEPGISRFLRENPELMRFTIQMSGASLDGLASCPVPDIESRFSKLYDATVRAHGEKAVFAAVLDTVEPFRLRLTATVQ